MVGWQLDAPKEAMALVTVGRGLSTRVRAPLLEALLDEGAGDAWWRAGDNGQALAAYERALAGLIAIQGPTGLDVARLHSSIGWIQMERGALAEAAKAYEASRAIRVALLGSSHPQLSATFNELGHLEEGQWHLEAALASFDACRAIHLANKGPRSLGVVRTEFNRARVLVELGRVDEAAAALAVGEAVLPTMAEVSPSTRAELEQGQARLALVRGQLDQAITLARMALASNEASSGPGHPFAAAVTVVLAQALLEKGRSVEAREVLRRSVAHQEARGELVSSEALRTRVLLARAERLAGDAAGARGTGEETIGRLPRVAGNERFKAEAWLELAEAHLASHTPRERALEAARAARDVAHAAGLSAPQQQAERFLASHASP
jgi:tetratricopeptide (TPR) repeat protein